MGIEKTNRTRDILKIIPGLVISSVLLFLVLRAINMGDFVDLIRAFEWWVLPLAICLFFLSLVARSLAWGTLLGGSFSRKRVFLTLNAGYFMNNVLPFRLGEVGRAVILSGEGDASFWFVLSTIMVERIFDLLMVVGMLLVSLPFAVLGQNLGWTAGVAGILVIGALIILFLIANRQTGVLAFLDRVHEKASLTKIIKREWAEKFLTGLAILTDVRKFLTAVIWLAMAWIITALTYFVVLSALVPGTKLYWASIGLGAAALGIAVPSAPGGIGVFEAVLGFVTSQFGVVESTAYVYALTLHLIHLVMTSVIGFIGVSVLSGSVFDIYRQVREKAGRD